MASRVCRSWSTTSLRWSSRRAVRTASDWNRSSLDEMSDRIAWSRDSSVTMRSCSGRTSRDDDRQTSVATSRISAVACASIARSPSSRRSSTAFVTVSANRYSVGVIKGSAGEGSRRAKSPRRTRPPSSGSRVEPE